MFKEGREWTAYQIWSEVIAYEFSRSLRVPVPPALVAFDSSTGLAGVLIEFFYGYPRPQGDEEPPFTTRLVPGADFLEGVRKLKDGRPHAVSKNLALCRALGVANGLTWWATALGFDALIGNRDRHSENWGFLIHRHADGREDYELAPLYDNGVSLGYEIVETKLLPSWPQERIAQYVARGVHHCSWTARDNRPSQHVRLCEDMVREFPRTKEAILLACDASEVDVADVLSWCQTFDGPLPLSQARAEFISRLTIARRAALIAALGG